MMQLGPQKTGKFQGFGFGLKAGGGAAGGGAAAARPPALARRPTGKPPGGVSDLFKGPLDDDRDASSSSSSKPSWSKPTPEAMQAQRLADELMAQDPSVFQYDEVIDDVKSERDQSAGSQAVRTDALQQKKRVGLTLMTGSDEVRAGQKRQAKYIEKVLVATDRRKVEQQVVEDRLLKKEKDARKDCEVFVTEAFKEELKKRQKFVDELEKQEVRDNIQAAEKQENGRGFADMYRNLLNGGLATSRGGEKVKEISAARLDPMKEEKKEEKEEEKEAAPEGLKEEGDVPKEEEEGKDASPSYGVQDVAAPSAGSKQAKKEEEAVVRAEKAMSARERFLARKRAAAEEAG